MGNDFHHVLLGDLPLQQGGVLAQASLAYQTFGELNAAGDNAILLLSVYSNGHLSFLPLIGEERVLDPNRYFIVLVNMFGNGLSTSPSNSLSQPGRRFPRVSVADNVHAQFLLLREHLGVQQLALVGGWALGAMQAWHWAAAYPDYVKRLMVICGTARCSPLCRVFLNNMRSALLSDSAFANGDYLIPPLRGLAAFGRTYAGWAYSAAFFRDELFRRMGYPSLEALLSAWERHFQQHDANDLLTLLETWHHADLSLDPRLNGEFSDSLMKITAEAIIMPCDTDNYFTVAEARIECDLLPHGKWRPLISPYGHCAGLPGRFEAESEFVERAMKDLLQRKI